MGVSEKLQEGQGFNIAGLFFSNKEQALNYIEETVIDYPYRKFLVAHMVVLEYVARGEKIIPLVLETVQRNTHSDFDEYLEMINKWNNLSNGERAITTSRTEARIKMIEGMAVIKTTPSPMRDVAILKNMFTIQTAFDVWKTNQNITDWDML